MLEYPHWNPTYHSAINCEGYVQNVDRPDVRNVVEATAFGGPAAHDARFALVWKAVSESQNLFPCTGSWMLIGTMYGTSLILIPIWCLG